MTVKTPPAPPIPDELDGLLRRLRMPYVRRAAPEVIATAAAQRWEPAEVLRVLLAEEAAGRDRATIAMRRRASGLPAGKTFDAWDEHASPIPKPPPSRRCARSSGSDAPRRFVSAGPSGTGKSHLVEALGHLAIDRGKTVAWHTLESLAVMLRRHRADDSVNQRDRPPDPRRPDRHRRHRHAPGRARRRRSAVPRRRRRLRETLASRSPATSTRPASTS